LQNAVSYAFVAAKNTAKQDNSNADDDNHHHHLFAQYAEMNSKICNVLDRKANNYSSNNCPP